MVKEKIFDKISSSIMYYESRIKNVEKFFDKLSTWGPYSAESPLKIREEISFMLKYSENKSKAKRYEEQLISLDKKLEKIKQKKGYTEKLLKELTDLVGGWERAIKYKELMFEDGNEFTNDLDGRDSCEILINELEEKKDVSELKKRVEKADLKLQKHAKKLFQRFYEYYESKEWDYYPKEYWWRHLKEFIEEKGENTK